MSFTGGGMGRRGACTTKRAYPSKAQAQSGLEWMVNHLHISAEAMEVQRCRHCKNWHVAHKTTKDRKGRR